MYESVQSGFCEKRTWGGLGVIVFAYFTWIDSLKDEASSSSPPVKIISQHFSRAGVEFHVGMQTFLVWG